MAKGKKISDLSIADSLVGDELFPFAKNGANGAISAEVIKKNCQQFLDHKFVALDGADGIFAHIDEDGLQLTLPYINPTTGETDSEDKPLIGIATVDSDGLMSASDKQSLCNKQNALSSSTDINIAEDSTHLSLTDRAKRYAFDDLFLEAVGTYGSIDYTHYEENGRHTPYYLNELWLTYEEARAVMDAGPITSTSAQMRYSYTKIRTNLPIKFGSCATGSSLEKFNVCGIVNYSSIEVLNLSTPGNPCCLADYQNAGLDNLFARANNLRKIIGVIDIGAFSKEMTKIFTLLPKLADIQLKFLRRSINLSNLPALSSASLRYMLTNRHSDFPTNPIVITLHPDVYAKIIASADNEQDDEWSGFIELAESKNATFATV